MYKIFFIAFAFSFSQLLYHTFSQNWIECSSGSNNQLNSVSVLRGAGSKTAWACGNNGTVLKASSPGINWQNVSGNGIPSHINLVTISSLYDYIPSPGFPVAITAGYDSSGSYVFRSSNGGLNWQLVLFQNGGYFCSIASGETLIPNYEVLIGNPVGGRWSIWKSTNKGISWDSAGLYLPQFESEISFNNSIFFYTFNWDMRIWFGTNNSRMYYSSNSGLNWVMQPTPIQNIYCITMRYQGAMGTFGYAGGSSLIFTSNSGSNWTQIPCIGSGTIMGISVFPPGILDSFYVIRLNNIYKTTNMGNSWSLNYTSPAGDYNHISYRDLCEINGYNPIFAVRSNGGISLNSDSLIPEKVTQIGSEVPNQFALFQNYPNPFNPGTNINFYVKKLSIIKIIIYDITGKPVKTLVNKELSPGTYNVDFNGINYASGIYYYRLEAYDFVETKKMVLVK